MTVSKRAHRVADLIHHQLAQLLKKEINDPRLEKITLTAVDVSPDLKQAKVFFSLLNVDDVKETTAVLDKASGYLRCLLAKSTALRHVPHLHFVYDESIEYGAKLSQLIDDAIHRDETDE